MVIKISWSRNSHGHKNYMIKEISGGGEIDHKIHMWKMERNHMGGSPIPLLLSFGQQSTTTLEQQTWYQIILFSASTSTTPSNTWKSIPNSLADSQIIQFICELFKLIFPIQKIFIIKVSFSHFKT